ncbi:uncharacterized protein FTOL_04572 [Fusarium torulosum]|uniref:Chromo domain-containing protein n=1 Tax=Fusarium torulosum TaxID=33205 RepID=A0AAE8M5N6_9HYPO|nr:uncharacterized protein FTOL_04572 [Fusarium torulosum]
MVRTRKSTSTSRASTPRTSTTPLNRISRRKREHGDSEEEYAEQPSSRKRRKSGTPRSGQQRRGSLQDKQGKNKGETGQEDKNRETAAQLSSDDGEQDGWWQVKRVVDERLTVADDGEIVNKCLVEWEPSPTGRTYEPEWIPITYLNAEARKDWEKEKKKKNREAEAKRREARNQRGLRNLTPSANQAEQAGVNDGPQQQTLNVSTPTRSRSNSFRKHVQSGNKPKVNRSSTLSEEPVPSIVSASSPEIAESPSEPSLLPNGKFAVLLSKPDNFNPSEYQSVSTQSSSQKISDLEEDDQRVAFASKLSQDTIPDSQDLSGHWDRREFESQSAVRPDYKPGSPKVPDDQQLVAADHPASVDRVGEAVTQQQSQSPVQVSGHLDVEEPSSVDAFAKFDPGFPDSDNEGAPLEDDTPHPDTGGFTDTANHSSEEGPEVHSIRDDQDPEVNDIKVGSPAHNTRLEQDNFSSNEHSHRDTESTQESQHSLDNQSFETANSQNSQTRLDSADCDVQGNQTQESISADQHSEDGQQVTEDHVSGAVDNAQSQQDHRGQEIEVERSVVKQHHRESEESSRADRSLTFAESNTNLQNCGSQERAHALDTASCLKSTLPPKAVAQSQDQTSSSEEISCVIPDSQDHSNTSAHTSASKALTVLSQDQVAPYVSQTEIVPDSAATTTTLDIPSHQPDQPRPVSLEKEDRFDSSIPSDPGSHRLERVPVASTRESLVSNNTPNPSVYYTQPQFLNNLPDISSSFSSRTGVLDEAAHTIPDQIPQSQSAKKSGVSQEERLEESQATRVVGSQLAGSQSRGIISGQDIEFATESQPTAVEVNTIRGSKRQLKSHSQNGSASEPPSELPRSTSGLPEMDRSISEPRSSAVDELKSFIDFGKDSLLTQVGESLDESLDETSYDVPSEGESMANTGTAGLDVVVSSPEVVIQSQPVYSVDPWKPEALGNTPEAPPPSISPASIMPVPNTHISAVDSMRQAINLAFNDSNDSLTHTLLGQDADDGMPPGTISPAVISRSVEPMASLHVLNFPGQDAITSEIESSGLSITMGQVPVDQDSDVSSESSQRDDSLLQYAITLPMQASRRPYYGEVIKDHKAEIQAFSRFFTGETQGKPDDSLVERIDDLFDRLFGICDYPQDVIGSSLESQPSSDIAKYSCDANSKFCFLFELMSALDGKEQGILIVVRSQELMRLIFAVTEVARIECSAESISKRTDYPSVTRITLALSTEEFDPFNFDVVIGYDFHFSRSSIARQLYTKSTRKSPLVLLLVTTHSIEHVSLHPWDKVSDLEAKNAILACTVSAGRYLEDPERGYGEPHKVAEVFAAYLNGNTDTLNWEPQTIPDDVLDIFENPMSQTRTLFSMNSLHGNGLKRKYATDDSDETDSKRICLPLRDLPVDSNNPPMPLAVRQLLDSVTPRGLAIKRQTMITIPLESLESIREKIDEYKRSNALAGEVEVELKTHINRLDSELKEFKKTSNKIAMSNRTALQERTMFEKEKKKAEAAARVAAEIAQRESAQQHKRIEELETTIARLKDDPESVNTEQALSESQQQLKVSEDKLKRALSDVEFMRGRYQDASAQVSKLTNNNKELTGQNEDLGQKASANLLAIHAQNFSSERQVLLQQIASLQAQVQQKDADLSTAHQKLNSLANGRNTRGGSMPRSPRVPSGMSPRPSRPGFAGSASRGTSPSGPGAQFMSQQARSERWNQLQ